MKKIAVVDGFSSGKFIAKALHQMGCELVHISSGSDLDDYYYTGFDYSIYTHAIVHENREETLAFLRQSATDVILAGAESGVLLADQLNEEMRLPYKNDFALTSARRNKFDMIECLRRHNLRAAKQSRFAVWEDALAWLREGEYPVVLKPLASAGSDGVFICHSEQETKTAFSEILHKKNKLNLVNEQVLFQAFLEGTEYVVNFVALDGHFLVTEVVKYHKRKLPSGNIVYDIDEIIDATFPEFTALVQYTRQVCACLGISNGPSHAEVMLTADGPCLVEIAARSDGILRPDVSEAVTGTGQIMATAMSIAAPEKFLALTKSSGYVLKKHAFNVCLITPKKGVFSAGAFLEKLQQLASFHKAEFYRPEGAQIEETRDVFSQPGTIYLVSDSKQQLWQDYKIIRELESAGGYYA